MSPSDPKRARRARRWTLGLFLAAAVLFGPGLVQWVGLRWRQHQLDRRLARLSAERVRLTQEQQRLETDPGYVEGLIRTTFKWAQDGELVITLDEPEARR
jgi:cell division protein FtsB